MYKLPKDRLYVTYFEGDAKQGLAPDDEAKKLWLEAGVAEDHILTGNAKDNFWGKQCVDCAVITAKICVRVQKWEPQDLADLVARYTLIGSEAVTPHI